MRNHYSLMKRQVPTTECEMKYKSASPGQTYAFNLRSKSVDALALSRIFIFLFYVLSRCFSTVTWRAMAGLSKTLVSGWRRGQSVEMSARGPNFFDDSFN